MKIKENIKETLRKGFVLLFIYIIITFCLMMATNRIERLDKNKGDFRNFNTSVSLNFSK